MFGPLGLPELLVIMVILLILFGYKRIGQLGKGLGEGIRNFKESIRPNDDDTADEPGKEKVEPK
jgi:sec-independent protein translocase protein TatA